MNSKLVLLFYLNRRRFLIGLGGTLSWILLNKTARAVEFQPKFSAYPFSLGVASGDPYPDSIVLWTRLAPEPFKEGGMPSIDIPLQWQIAIDSKMSHVVQRGTIMATPELAHSVHVEVKGLEPSQNYWYQFKAGSELSQIGKTRTAPSLKTQLKQLSFAFSSCQDWQNGLYIAYKYLAEEDIDFFVFLGDYIYEDGVNSQAFRQHNGGECITLTDYRNRYAQYKSDPNLQAAHAAFPWIVTWDDHEVDNNYANLIPENEQKLEAFEQRRINAYQAYYEHLPLRLSSLPQEGKMQLYRSFQFGNLAQFFVLDTRQYRTNQPCGDNSQPLCAEALDEKATMLGLQQEQWLLNGLNQSSSRWNVIAQQVMMAPYDLDPRPKIGMFNMDQWDGYVAARQRLFASFPLNSVVITGDLHSSWVNDLKIDFNDLNSRIIGTEFVSPALSSNFPSKYITPIENARIANPHNKYFEGTRQGYVRCIVTPQYWKSDYQVVSDVRNSQASITTLASFEIETGKPGVKKNY